MGTEDGHGGVPQMECGLSCAPQTEVKPQLAGVDCLRTFRSIDALFRVED